MSPELQAESGFPLMLQHYHSLYPLEDLKTAEEAPSKAVGVQSLVIKGVSAQDGHSLALRKIGWRQVWSPPLRILPTSPLYGCLEQPRPGPQKDRLAAGLLPSASHPPALSTAV